MNRKQFEQYIEHFNKKEYDKVTSYFAPDVSVEYFDDAYGPYGPAHTVNGPAEFIANYKALHERTKEALEIGMFTTWENHLFVELYTEFITFKDAPAGQTGPMSKKGDIIIMTNWVVYDFDDKGKMKRIRIAHFRNSDPKTAKYK
jgi:hypothetical protein